MGRIEGEVGYGRRIGIGICREWGKGGGILTMLVAGSLPPLSYLTAVPDRGASVILTVGKYNRK